jgi:hypothetical protein
MRSVAPWTAIPRGVQVSPEGASPRAGEVVGYTIIEAENMDAALALTEGHPHLNMPGGCTIEVHEAQPVPGM